VLLLRKNLIAPLKEDFPCASLEEESSNGPLTEKSPCGPVREKSPCVPCEDSLYSLYKSVLVELECGSCSTVMIAPSLVWQCQEGHTQCGHCGDKTVCGLCGKLIQGRNFALERIAQHIY